MAKKVLIVAVNKDWMGISRLPSGLSRAGFITYAVCPKGSYISKTKYLAGVVCFPVFSTYRSKIFYFPLFYSILRFRPDHIIPGDEEALLALQKFSNFMERIPFLNKISKIIRRSLTKKENDKKFFSKSIFINHCHSWGVNVPLNFQINKVDEAIRAGRKLGFPVVLKLDEGYGGTGVFICSDEKELIKKVTNALEYSLLNEIKFLLRRFFFITLFDKQLKISLQKYIKGVAGLAPFYARNGVLLASNPMLRLETYPNSIGATSVSRGFYNEDVIKYVETVVRNLSYNGFGSLDFMVDEKTNEIFVIELNPRPTPCTHFSSSLVTHDLCDIFYRGFNQKDIQTKKIKDFTVAMFPYEKIRDPESPYLKEAFHDIPIDDPHLLKVLEAKF